MKVSELADLADTTVRTVRHYHHLGLLDVPATVGGARDYGLDHLARVLRIRWLVTSGLSLTAIRDLLPAAGPLDSEAVVGELTDVLADIDRHLERLQATRSSVRALIERTENDEDVSPLPAGLSAFYRRLAERMPDDRSRQAMEMERSMATVLAVRGQLPPAVDDLIAALDADDEDDIVSIFESMARIAEDADDLEARDLVTAAVSRSMAKHPDLFAEVLAAITVSDGGTVTSLGTRLVRIAFPDVDVEALASEWLGRLGAQHPPIADEAPRS